MTDLREAAILAYGHLWHVNTEPLAPIPMRSPEEASYAARKLLRDLLTSEERGRGINEAGRLIGRFSDDAALAALPLALKEEAGTDSFHLTIPVPTKASKTRTPQDFAIEHAEYMAKAAERLMAAFNDEADKRGAWESSDDDDEAALRLEPLEAALEVTTEAMASMKSGIYEFRKRRDHAAQVEASSMARFAETFCSQCGKSLGPGAMGCSHCSDHETPEKWRKVCADHIAAVQIGKASEAQRAPQVEPSRALQAIQKLIGTPDDPNLGWRGAGGTETQFACEFCKALDENCVEMVHTPNCPVPAARLGLGRLLLDVSPLSADAWQPIATAPKDGTAILIYHPEGGVCEAFCSGEGFAWQCMDGTNTVTSTAGNQIPRMTSFISPPTHWQPLPAPPSQGSPT